MELKSEDIKSTLIRLQGQIDVWTNLYQITIENEKKVTEKANDTAKKD